MDKIREKELKEAMNMLKEIRNAFAQKANKSHDLDYLYEKEQDALSYAISTLTEVIEGRLVRPMGSSEIDKIADSCMYDFPKSYTNAQIIAFQKGIDKMWAQIKKKLLNKVGKPHNHRKAGEDVQNRLHR